MLITEFRRVFLVLFANILRGKEGGGEGNVLLLMNLRIENWKLIVEKFFEARSAIHNRLVIVLRKIFLTTETCEKRTCVANQIRRERNIVPTAKGRNGLWWHSQSYEWAFRSWIRTRVKAAFLHHIRIQNMYIVRTHKCVYVYIYAINVTLLT